VRCLAVVAVVALLSAPTYDARADAADTIGIQETSLQYSDSRAQMRHDVRTLFEHARASGNVLLAGTESSTSNPLYRLLPRIGSAYGFGVWDSPSGDWVAWDRSWGRLVARGHVPVIAGHGGVGRHAARGITWATIRPDDPAIGRRVTIGSVHYLTRSSLSVQPRGNLLLRRAAGTWSRRHGSGSALAFLAGDTNTPDRTRNAFPPSLRTSWDGLDRYPGTRKGATIDAIARRRYDARTRFVGASVFPRLPGFSDHDLISARVRIASIQ
jgi:hypothetical protein